MRGRTVTDLTEARKKLRRERRGDNGGADKGSRGDRASGDMGAETARGGSSSRGLALDRWKKVHPLGAKRGR